MQARCPKCKEPVDAKASKCEACGEDFTRAFPLEEHTTGEFDRSLVHGPVGDFALKVGQFASMMGATITVVGVIFAVQGGQWFNALVVCPLMFFFQLAMYVVFRRVEDAS